ncbi:MAG: hypothetical protein NTY30_02895 [Candidatus Berkelbacteria bacterium]|nr:hypothetical protein [Candidatus Berkelbacteria bacterium]
MVTETINPAEIGNEIDKIDKAAHVLYRYAQMPTGSSDLEDIGAKLKILVGEVDSGNHDQALELETEIYEYFNQHVNLPPDPEKDSANKLEEREKVRNLIDQLGALALKYSEFESENDESQNIAAA